jgi:hypothetical protein
MLFVAHLLGACASAPPQPTQPPYEPKFTYSVPKATDKIDVTVGIVAPQFSGDGIAYFKEQRDDEVVKGLLRGMRTSFAELLVAKGFNTSGPFDALDIMTFPEKRGADFILYPEFDIDSGYKISNVRTEVKTDILFGNKAMVVCDVSLAPRGSISLIVQEPLSKEKMWVKRLDLAVERATFSASNQVCEKQGVTREIANAWAKAHEQVFVTVMDSLNKYVNGEEFQTLKRQSAELRAKKAY